MGLGGFQITCGLAQDGDGVGTDVGFIEVEEDVGCEPNTEFVGCFQDGEGLPGIDEGYRFAGGKGDRAGGQANRAVFLGGGERSVFWLDARGGAGFAVEEDRSGYFKFVISAHTDGSWLGGYGEESPLARGKGAVVLDL